MRASAVSASDSSKSMLRVPSIVIAGATKVLRRDRPVVVIELLTRADFEGVQRTFDELDYRFLSLHPGFEVREQQMLRFFLDGWLPLVPAEDHDRLREVLAEAAAEMSEFLAAAGEPLDPDVVDPGRGAVTGVDAGRAVAGRGPRFGHRDRGSPLPHRATTAVAAAPRPAQGQAALSSLTT